MQTDFSYDSTPYYVHLCDLNASRFTGKERDTESGLDYFGARYYASTLGRFMSPDWSEEPDPVPYADVENPQTLNLYGYVTNNPLRLYDPTGHDGCCDVLPSMAEVDAGIAYLEGGVETVATVSAGAVVGTVGLIGSQIFAPSRLGYDPAEQRYLAMMSKGGNQNHSDSYFENLTPEELDALLRDPRTSPSDRAKIVKQQKANRDRNAQKRGGGKQKKPPVKNDPASQRARQQQVNPLPAPLPDPPQPDPPKPPKDDHGDHP
jgi:RHS repeat-associated protein